MSRPHPGSYLLHLCGVLGGSRAGSARVQPDTVTTGPAGVSPPCPAKGGSSRVAPSHPPFPGNGARSHCICPQGGP